MMMPPNLFDRFGGVRPMAAALGEKPSTVQSWKTSGRVPATKQPEVLDKAVELGIEINAADVVFPLNRRPTMTAVEGVDATVCEVDCDRCAVLQRGDAA